MTTVIERFDSHRSQVHAGSCSASYIDTGGPGRPALFVHGIGTSSYLWRHVIDQLDGQCRCVAVDLPLHGQTPATADQDFSLRAWLASSPTSATRSD
jgi:pimeloyl-ACP methyl ester carboxylesterase